VQGQIFKIKLTPPVNSYFGIERPEINIKSPFFYLRRVCKMCNEIKVKVKCTLVQALRLCTGSTAYRGSRGIALLFLDNGTRRG